MNKPVFVYPNVHDAQATVTASSTASGYDPADVLSLNQATGWKPANAAPVWDDAGVTDLPAAQAGVVVQHGVYAYFLAHTQKTYRLDLTAPTGAWSDAAVTDHPQSNSVYAAHIVADNKWFTVGGGASAKAYYLDLTAPTGAWNDAGVTDYPQNVNGPAGTTDGTYVYVVGGSNYKAYRLPLAGLTGAWQSLPDLPHYGADDAWYHGGYVYAMKQLSLPYAGVDVVVMRLDVANPTGWEVLANPVPGKIFNAGKVLVGDSLYTVGGQWAYSSLQYAYTSVVQRLIMAQSLYGTWDGGLPDYPREVSAPMLAYYNGMIYSWGGYEPGSYQITTGYAYRLTSEELTIDLGTMREIDTIALTGTGTLGANVEVFASTDNFSSSNDFLGSRVFSGDAIYLRINPAAYRYIRLRFHGYGAGFVLGNVTIAKVDPLPYMSDGVLLEGRQAEGRHHHTADKMYMGSTRNALLRIFEPDWGKILSAEKPAFDAWAAACVDTMSPFYFVPDTDNPTVHFCWVDPRYRYDIKMKTGSYEIGKITMTARG